MPSMMYKKITHINPKGNVLNLDNYGNGTHWVAIKPIGKDEYYYEDSFGVEPPFHKGLILYNTKVKQKPYEDNCGGRAIKVLNSI